MIGSETALVLENEDNIVYIPTAAVMCMRLMEQADEKRPKSSKDIYYG